MNLPNISFAQVEHAIETTLHVMQRGAAALQTFEGEQPTLSIPIVHPDAAPAEKVAFKVAAQVIRAIGEGGASPTSVTITLDPALIAELKALLPEIEKTAALVGVKL